MDMAHAACVAAVMLFILWPVTTTAQVVEGYLAGGLGGWTNPSSDGLLLGGGGGVDVNVTPLTAIELDGSLLGARDGLLLALSAGGRVRFLRLSEGCIVPFAAAGVTRMRFFEFATNGWHLGGGVEFARTAHRSIRLEFRDMIRTDYPSHYWVVRAGVAFR
jgi:hypothetical protein